MNRRIASATPSTTPITIINDINFSVRVSIALDSDHNPTWVFDDGLVDTNAINTEEFLYTSDINGITARILLSNENHINWNMTMQFVYDGACYQVERVGLLPEDMHRDLHETIKMFIDAFD